MNYPQFSFYKSGLFFSLATHVHFALHEYLFYLLFHCHTIDMIILVSALIIIIIVIKLSITD